MKKALLLLAILLSMSLQLYCVNHMDLLTTMTGEHDGARMGNSMASLDFNGDGYDDLVVSSRSWGYNQPPDSIMYGKIYFYWGGPNFDNIPDMTLTGTYYWEYAASVYNLGDVNGDGIDDLGVSHAGTPIGIHEGNPKLSIFYGGQEPDTQPDYSVDFDYYHYSNIDVDALGDINGDGYDDIGLVLIHDSTNLFRIIYGNSLINVNYLETGSRAYEANFHGLGDINNDGFDDFSIGYETSGRKKVRLYTGETNIDVQIFVMLYASTTNIFAGSWRTGDNNGDGIDDFIGYSLNNNLLLWYGRNEFSNSNDVLITPAYIGNQLDNGLKYGDVNGDGYSDILGTNPLYDWNSGRAGLWLGGQIFNGTMDFVFEPPSGMIECNFGDASVTGDFNGDGCCDYAIAAPYTETTWFTWNGKVYVYAGNTELGDTTVDIEDEQNPVSDVSKWDIILSPNPVTKCNLQLNVRLTGIGYKNAYNLHLGVFDIKGRTILDKLIPESDLKVGDANLKLKGIKPGTYIVEISDNNKAKLITRKVTIK